MVTRTFVVVPALLLALLLTALPATATDAPTAAAKETAWEELMPRDWDPMKDFSAGEIGLVQEGSVKERNMMRRMRELWDSAPTNPKLDGARVRLPGYVVPLEEVKGELKEFLLVPYFGACIHSPPPPANQIVHVKAQAPLKGWRTMDAVWVSGTLQAARADTAMGASGYLIADPQVERYVLKPR